MGWDRTCEAVEMAFLARFLTALPLLIFSPLAMVIAVCAMALADLLWRILKSGSRGLGQDVRPTKRDAATVVIPNWNGRDLLERYLPSLEVAMSHHDANEILVVDNGSTDGSVDYLRTHHPRVKLLALPSNLGFGGGSNAGFEHPATRREPALCRWLRHALFYAQGHGGRRGLAGYGRVSYRTASISSWQRGFFLRKFG